MEDDKQETPLTDAEWLWRQGECPEAETWLYEQERADVIAVVRLALAAGKLEWADWSVMIAMTPAERIYYAVYATNMAIREAKSRGYHDAAPLKTMKTVEAYLSIPLSALTEADRAAVIKASQQSTTSVANAHKMERRAAKAARETTYGSCAHRSACNAWRASLAIADAADAAASTAWAVAYPEEARDRTRDAVTNAIRPLKPDERHSVIAYGIALLENRYRPENM